MLLPHHWACALYPELEKDDDIFFCIGDGKATFEGYDGQPVIIWNDCKSFELFNVCSLTKNKLKSLENTEFSYQI